MIIAGLTIPMVAVRPRPVRIGERARAESGALRSTVRAEKRAYECVTEYLTAAETAALRAAVAADAVVTVDPALYDATAAFSAMVELQGGEVVTAGGVLQQWTLVVEEV